MHGTWYFAKSMHIKTEIRARAIIHWISLPWGIPRPLGTWSGFKWTVQGLGLVPDVCPFMSCMHYEWYGHVYDESHAHIGRDSLPRANIRGLYVACGHTTSFRDLIRLSMGSPVSWLSPWFLSNYSYVHNAWYVHMHGKNDAYMGRDHWQRLNIQEI